MLWTTLVGEVRLSSGHRMLYATHRLSVPVAMTMHAGGWKALQDAMLAQMGIRSPELVDWWCEPC